MKVKQMREDEAGRGGAFSKILDFEARDIMEKIFAEFKKAAGEERGSN